MNRSERMSKVIQKCLLKVIVAFIASSKQFKAQLTQIAKVSSIILNGQPSTVDTCFKCKKVFSNILLYMIHLQIFHNDILVIKKYQFESSCMSIIFKQSPSIDYSSNVRKWKDQTIFVDARDKNQGIQTVLSAIFAKFGQKRRKPQQQYYSAIDIFRRLEQSEQNQEQLGVSSIERQLEIMRINQFLDVSDSDKHLMIKWNDLVHATKKSKGLSFIDNDNILEICQQFSLLCRQQNISRINLLMHLWTLWSSGKIIAYSINHCLAIYDNLYDKNQ